jgi:protein tyrosine phosphatase (PTP) superfamily phosphohydrolase (DUF442 family)
VSSVRWLAAAALALALEHGMAGAQPALGGAPNVVVISPRLVTSGQPSAQALARLGAEGFGAVVYLAPPTVGDAVRDEAFIVGRQGIAFVNLPIDFDHPNEADFRAFAAVLSAFAERKVLVHCQVNLRASSLVFLYRSIVARDDPRSAYEAVSKVWVPEGPWKQLILDLLRKNAIAFDPF